MKSVRTIVKEAIAKMQNPELGDKFIEDALKAKEELDSGKTTKYKRTKKDE